MNSKAEKYKNLATTCLSKKDYKGYKTNLKYVYDITQNEDDKIMLEKAVKMYQIYLDIQEFLKIDQKDYYAVLGLESKATHDEIRKAYKKLALKYHPNITKLQESNEVFGRIQMAYTTLKDEKTRRDYDFSRIYSRNTTYNGSERITPEHSFASGFHSTTQNPYGYPSFHSFSSTGFISPNEYDFYRAFYQMTNGPTFSTFHRPRRNNRQPIQQNDFKVIIFIIIIFLFLIFG
ncbi:DnaJ-like protein [Hamiltosporidium magnivora]|uniref:DnaJ-like protein n=1 Tax=Hamiltosporidium magnivora TaxID=148818 RepID=A0A4Q9LAS5_9MICR|nr:DnaJ-like protein [Hamiltosporidium magnivora]